MSKSVRHFGLTVKILATCLAGMFYVVERLLTTFTSLRGIVLSRKVGPNPEILTPALSLFLSFFVTFVLTQSLSDHPIPILISLSCICFAICVYLPISARYSNATAWSLTIMLSAMFFVVGFGGWFLLRPLQVNFGRCKDFGLFRTIAIRYQLNRFSSYLKSTGLTVDQSKPVNITCTDSFPAVMVRAEPSVESRLLLPKSSLDGPIPLLWNYATQVLMLELGTARQQEDAPYKWAIGNIAVDYFVSAHRGASVLESLGGDDVVNLLLRERSKFGADLVDHSFASALNDLALKPQPKQPVFPPNYTKEFFQSFLEKIQEVDSDSEEVTQIRTDLGALVK